MEILVAMMILGSLAVVLLAAFRSTRAQCPKCGERAVHWKHERQDGHADQRYKHNPHWCAECGWKST